jgi:hypothetical protein
MPCLRASVAPAAAADVAAFSPLRPPLSLPPQVVLPLELNTRVKGRWKDGEFYRCKLLERRILPEFNAQTAEQNPAAAYEYYVHFSGSEHSRGRGREWEGWGVVWGCFRRWGLSAAVAACLRHTVKLLAPGVRQGPQKLLRQLRQECWRVTRHVFPV